MAVAEGGGPYLASESSSLSSGERYSFFDVCSASESPPSTAQAPAMANGKILLGP